MFRIGFVLLSVVLMLVGGGCFSAVAGPATSTAAAVAAPASDGHSIQSAGDLVCLFAGDLARTININGGNVCTSSLAVGGADILAVADEISFRIENALPNRCPVGLDAKTAGSVTQKTTVSDSTDALDVNKEGGSVYAFSKIPEEYILETSD